MTDVRDLLARVADGSLDPAEAERLLGEQRAAATTHDTAVLPRPEGPVRRIAVRVAYRSLRVVGDPGVATAAVDGEHRLVRDGDALVVSDAFDAGSFSMSQPGQWASLLRQQHRLVVRVNPALAVDVEVSAGSLAAEGVPRLGRVRVTAGTVRVHDATDPLDLVVQAGSATVVARPTSGHWTLRAESGSLTLRLLPGSDARITGHASLGRTVVGGDGATSAVVGAGSADVDVEAVMGNAVVELP